jgi:hypothetical protein
MRFETYELISLIFKFFQAVINHRQITETVDTESVDMGACLYFAKLCIVFHDEVARDTTAMS